MERKEPYGVRGERDKGPLPLHYTPKAEKNKAIEVKKIVWQNV